MSKYLDKLLKKTDPFEPSDIDALRARYQDQGGRLGNDDIPVLLWGLIQEIKEFNQNMEWFMDHCAQDYN